VKKAILTVALAVAVMAVFGVFATSASAYPSVTSRCDGDSTNCHAAGAGATINVSMDSTSTTTATYDVAMTGASGSGWAIFDGTTRLAGSTATTGTFTVDLGKTYDVFAVDGTTHSYVTTSVSPVAPSEEATVSLDETIPPVTTSDVKSSYVGTATITLSATDGEGQGVAYIYYRVDGGLTHLFTVGMVAQTSVSVAAPLVGTASHTIIFWSQDAAGNVEAHNTATFTVAGPAAAADKTSTDLTMSISRASRKRGGTFTVSGDIDPAFSGASIVIQARKPGGTAWLTQSISPRTTSASGHFSVSTSLHTVGTWTYRAKFTGNATYLGSSATAKIQILR
jgi:hypothetical protein